MHTTFMLPAGDSGVAEAITGFLQKALALETVDGLLAPMGLPYGGRVMPALIAEPGRAAEIVPFSPAFPVNAAGQLGRLTRGETDARLAAWLRPCEIRAFVELVKLNQASADNVILIGADCPGAMTNRDHGAWAGDESPWQAQDRFCGQAFGDGVDPALLSPACRICEHMTPDGADVAVRLWGNGPSGGIELAARTVKGRELLDALGFAQAEPSGNRGQALEQKVAEREQGRDAVFEKVRGEIDGLEKLSGYLADCVNCRNCRVACPVCYCRECVFNTEVFDHDPHQYLRWAARQGAVRLPADTLFFHLTRMSHMSHACVGCGQCSNACPNDVPVAELFRTVAWDTQAAFGYRAGLDPDAAPPLAVFRENEFTEVVASHA